MFMANHTQSAISRKIFVALAMVILSFLIIFISEKTSFFNLGSSTYSNKPLTTDGFFFDTYVSVTIYDSKDNYSHDLTTTDDIYSLLETCMNMCKDYENIFSRTLETSELYKINHNKDFINGVDTPISNTLVDCINKTLEYSAVFGEKYSIMSGSLCDIWDFNNAVIPDDKSIASNCISIDSYDLAVKNNSLKLSFNIADFQFSAEKFGYIDIDNNKTNISLPDPALNLGASAKGYIAEQLREFLIDNGIQDAIIDLGGNIVVIGNKYDDSMYKIGIKKPFSEENQSYAVCQVADMSIVTSGIYERYFEQDGNIYHHIIDCSTGYPADNDILSVTIITDNSLMADCYSTGCLLLGKDNAMNLINDTEGVECIIIDSNYNLLLSDGLTYNNDYIVLK